MEILHRKILAFKELGAREDYLNEILQHIDLDKKIALRNYDSLLRSKFDVDKFPCEDRTFTKKEVMEILYSAKEQIDDSKQG